MDRNEALDYISFLLKDSFRFHTSVIVDTVLARVKTKGEEQAWTDAVMFIKKSSWEEFCHVSLTTSDDPPTKARYDVFKEKLFSEIQAYWDGLMRGFEKR